MDFRYEFLEIFLEKLGNWLVRQKCGKILWKIL